MRDLKEIVREELNCRDKAIMSIISTSGLTLKETKSLTVGNYLKSFEYAHMEFFRGCILTLEEIYEFIQTDDLVSIFEMKDMFGDIYYTCNSPESTRLIMDYIMARTRNEGRLEQNELLFPDEEIEGGVVE